MNIRIFNQRLSIMAASTLMTLLSIPAANAGPLAIADTPLFLTGTVKPNLIMAIDDSGSMDGEVLLPGNDGAAWWRTGLSGTCTAVTDVNSFTGCVANSTQDVAGTGKINFNYAGTASGTWKKFVYLFPNGTGSNTEDRRRYADGTDDHYAIPPLPAFAWSRSPDYNGAYFDPTAKYPRWLDGGGYTFTDSSPTAAQFDPVYPPPTGQPAAGDITSDVAGQTNVAPSAACDAHGALGANYNFRVFTGMTIPAGACIRSTVAGRNWETVRSTGCQVGVNNGCLVTTSASNAPANTNQTYTLPSDSSIGIRYFPATFYLSALAPVAFGYTAAPVRDGFAPSDTTTPSLYRYEIKPGNFAVAANYTAAIQSFANWFTYYRKRHLALRAGLGSAFEKLSGTRVAGFTINDATGNPPNAPNVTMDDIDVTANRDALYQNFYLNWTGNGGTPNRRAVANVIRNFRRTDAAAPITQSCQRNFGMLFTDGFSNPPAANDGINGIVGNADSAAGAPYQDAVTETLADAVYSAYNTPLRTGTGFPTGTGLVPSACKNLPLDPRLDCNKDVHMNFYAITLGTRGILFDPDASPAVDPYVTNPAWPSTFPARHPSAVDDLWHATINGRGQLLNAASSSELAAKLGSVLGSIASTVGSASSAAVNSGSINSDTRLFQASFDPKDWSGELSAREVKLDGTLGTKVLATIPAPGTRQIITVNSSGVAKPFTWAGLSADATRVGELQPAPSDGLANARLDWLRGDQTKEAPATANFRKRTKILGDLINSAPAFVGSPAFRYPDNLEARPYSAFRTANKTRTHMVYAGSNDGMLHAFYSDDSDPTNSGRLGPVNETFAFIPGSVFKNLYKLTSPSYTHQYFVDGSPITGDAFVGGDWHTMLVAGLNKGGQAIYALDVTDPASLSEANAAGVFKWEYSDANDVDLGYTFARPSIIRMNNGVWAAAFGNGYNNTEADGRQSTTGKAFLYIMNLWTGALIRKIDTGVGTTGGVPNGLSTPVFVDIDGDSDVDFAYAGDLFGNLWKFDLSSNNPSSWTIANSAPLFVAKDSSGKVQPITARPNVSRGAQGAGLVVLFGTGKYLEISDTIVASATAQTFYGLSDPNTGAVTDQVSGRGVLTQQSITSEVTVTGLGDLRTTSAIAPSAASRGWYMDLVSPSGNQGEMQVTDSLVRNGHVVFTTLVPSSDPCQAGGTSWLMEINLFTGARLDNTPFDLNNDGKFDDLDKVGSGASATPVSGVRTTVGITPKPAPLSGEKCDYLIFPGTSGGTETRCRDPGPRGSGRQSWRQAH